MGEFRMPDLCRTTGSLTYVAGPDGERLGRGYHRYEILASGEDGVEGMVLVGVVGAVKHILAERTFQPLVFGSEPVTKGGFWDYAVHDGVLYGYTQDPADTANLGAWPPEGAYDGQ